MSKISQKNLEQKVLVFIRERGLVEEGDTIYVALSGGPDSVCLFHILTSLKDKLKINLKALHFNHKMRGADSEKDAKFVKKLCETHDIELFIGERGEKEVIKNENDARKLRYAYFEKILKNGRGVKLALAHNANDVAETFLHRLIRGSGIKGLSSISPLRKNLIRPLLPFSRDDILSYLKSQNINYRTDKTNLIPIYTRNKIRLKIIPKLMEFNPSIIETLARTASLVASDYDFIRKSAGKEIKKIKQSKGKYIFEREEFLKQHSSIQREMLRILFESFNAENDITEDHIYKCINLIKKGIGAKTLLLPHSLRLEFKSGKIYVFNIADLRH